AAEPLDERERILAGDLDLAHVADVEEAGACADRCVLRRHAGVLDGHLPAGKGDHARVGGAVNGVEWQFAKLGYGWVGHEHVTSAVRRELGQKGTSLHTVLCPCTTVK